jgi:hypothetical protein
MPRLSQRTAIVAICAAAVLALGLLLSQLWLFRALSWPEREQPGHALLGFNFSCDPAEYLLLEDPALGPAGYVSDARPGRAEWCAGILDRLLQATGARAVRISLDWDEIEPDEGTFDFSLTDALVAAAAERGATVSLSVGMKAQRHPEYYIPEWARPDLPDGAVVSDDAQLRQRALVMVVAAVRHYASNPTIDSWSAENEPFIASGRAHNWSLDAAYVADVVFAIRRDDPLFRPVVINHAQHFVMDRRWKQALALGDVLGQSLYPARNLDLFGVPLQANIARLGPLMPNYAYQARTAHEGGKQFWITELQGEPWTDGDARLIGPDNPSPNLTPQRMASNLGYALRSGADRIYLWGAEWWLFENDNKGDSRWLAAAEWLFRQGAAK